MGRMHMGFIDKAGEVGIIKMLNEKKKGCIYMKKDNQNKPKGAAELENTSASQKCFPAAVILSIIAAVIVGIYLLFAWYFHSHFFFRTMLNGVSVSGKSAEAVKKIITDEISGYSLELVEREDKTEQLKGADISLEPKFGDSIEKLIQSQNAFTWPVCLFSGADLEETTMVDFSEKQLKKVMLGLDCMQSKQQTIPIDAYISEYSSNGYEIIPEEMGTLINEDKFYTVLTEAVNNLAENISLEKEDCYVNPEVLANTKELVDQVDTLNAYTGVTIKYTIGDKTEVLDGNITNKWMLADGYDVTINETAVEDYVADLASAYNTAFRKRKLKTASGTTIDIKGGDYGWKVDKEAEKMQILEELKAGVQAERDLNYSQTAASHGENDYGDTYVEINLTAQHLYFYKNGSLLVESDFVSGNISKNYDTPEGAYSLTYKERDAVLKGENYATDVSYWMPYCNNVGMHDAPWRSSFGGNTYKSSGSHGCVNLPPSVAAKIYENIEKGDPVLVYTLAGTESAAAAAQDAASVVNMINGFGEVTLESETAVVAARKMYNLLSDKGKALVSNYDMLAAAEAQVAALKAQAGQAPPAQ